jgi:hypothetical protein
MMTACASFNAASANACASAADSVPAALRVSVSATSNWACNSASDSGPFGSTGGC